VRLFLAPVSYNRASREERFAVVSPVLEILQAHHADNFGWALACCAWQRDIAEDVLQEAYLRVLDGRASFAGLALPKTWFFAVIRHVAAEVQRTRRRHSILNLRLAATDGSATGGMVAGGSNPLTDMVQADESSQQLQSALMQLPFRQREVLHLVFYAELTLEECAEVLGVSVGSVRTHYHRGKQRLADLLDIKEVYAN
jgi:RNA polymerase sigma factor (sigma-70 family)